MLMALGDLISDIGMYMYIYMCIYICVCSVFIYIHVFTYMHAEHTHIYMYIPIYPYVHIIDNTYSCMYIPRTKKCSNAFIEVGSHQRHNKYSSDIFYVTCDTHAFVDSLRVAAAELGSWIKKAVSTI